MNPTLDLELYLCPHGHRVRVDPTQPNLIVKKDDHGKEVMVPGVCCGQCSYATYTMDELIKT